MRAAILGAGSIGMTTGALIVKNGGTVDLIDSFEENVRALNEKGATVTGTLDFNVPAAALTPEQVTGIYDLVILLCKQTASEEALKSLLPHLGEDSVVLTLQNGIPEETVARHVGWERTMGGIVMFGATWRAPGVVECTSAAESMLGRVLFILGEPSGRITPRLLAVQKFLGQAGVCGITEHLMGERWLKVMINAAMSGMSAALGCTFGDVLDNDTALNCAAHIMDEAIKCCHARGYRMEKLDGHDLEEQELHSLAELPEKKARIREIWDAHRRLKASMLQDLEKGRATEIDAINGQVGAAGRELGIPTPYSDMVVAVVKAAEQFRGVLPMEAGLRFFKILDETVSGACHTA